MFKNGQRVEWQERRGTTKVFTGTVINEERYADGSNPFGFHTIRVDQEHRLAACATAREKSMGWVCRSVTFSGLRAIEA